METPHVLLLYDTIDAFQVRRLAEALTALQAHDPPVRVQLRIHSPGGEVMSGFALYHLLQNLRREGLEIETVVDGLAASMASVVALAGHPVKMAENARLLLHNPWALAEGTSDQLAAHAAELKRIQDELLGIYAERATLKKDALQALMNDERYITAQEARRYGLVDEVLPAVLALEARAKTQLRPLALYQAYRDTGQAPPAKLHGRQLQAADELAAARQALEAERVAFQEARAHWLASEAIRTGKLPAAAEPHLQHLAAVAFAEAASLVAALLPGQEPRRLTERLLTPKADERADWNLRRWEKEDPEGLADLRRRDPRRYQELYQATYQTLSA